MKITNNSGTTQDARGVNTQNPTSGPSAAANPAKSRTMASAEVPDTNPDSNRYNYEKELKLKFPGAQIEVEDLSDSGALRRYAQTHFGSFQIVLSPEALERMEKDVDFRKKCEELIAKTRKSLYDQASRLGNLGRQVVGVGMFIDEEGNVSQWTASKEKYQPGIGNQPGQNNQATPPWFPSTSTTKDGTISRFQGKDGKKYVIKRTLNYRPAKDLSKLAKSRNQQMVKSTISSIRGSIYQLKSAGGDKKVTSQLVNQAEQVILKAQIKIKHLKKEELMEFAQKKAEKQSDIKRAMHLKRMLEENRVKRTVREHAQIRDYYPTPQEIRREEEKAKEWVESVTGVSSGSTLTTGMQAYMPTGQVTGAPDVSAPGGGAGVFIDITL